MPRSGGLNLNIPLFNLSQLIAEVDDDSQVNKVNFNGDDIDDPTIGRPYENHELCLTSDLDDLDKIAVPGYNINIQGVKQIDANTVQIPNFDTYVIRNSDGNSSLYG